MPGARIQAHQRGPDSGHVHGLAGGQLLPRCILVVLGKLGLGATCEKIKEESLSWCLKDEEELPGRDVQAEETVSTKVWGNVGPTEGLIVLIFQGCTVPCEF